MVPFLPNPVCSTPHSGIRAYILHDLITGIIVGDRYILWSYSLCIFLHSAASSNYGPQHSILEQIQPVIFPKLTDQVPHPYKITGSFVPIIPNVCKWLERNWWLWNCDGEKQSNVTYNGAEGTGWGCYGVWCRGCRKYCGVNVWGEGTIYMHT